MIAMTLALAGCSNCDSGAPPHAAPSTPAADDAEVDGQIRDATARARTGGKRVLLVYVGDDDDADTQLVRRYLAESAAASAVARGYERVLVNVKSDMSLHARL